MASFPSFLLMPEGVASFTDMSPQWYGKERRWCSLRERLLRASFPPSDRKTRSGVKSNHRSTLVSAQIYDITAATVSKWTICCSSRGSPSAARALLFLGLVYEMRGNGTMQATGFWCLKALSHCVSHLLTTLLSAAARAIVSTRERRR